MASDETPAPTDIKPHEAAYAGFLAFTKWGTILSVITAVVVIAILVS